MRLGQIHAVIWALPTCPILPRPPFLCHSLILTKAFRAPNFTSVCIPEGPTRNSHTHIAHICSHIFVFLLFSCFFVGLCYANHGFANHCIFWGRKPCAFNVLSFVFSFTILPLMIAWKFCMFFWNQLRCIIDNSPSSSLIWDYLIQWLIEDLDRNCGRETDTDRLGDHREVSPWVLV